MAPRSLKCLLWEPFCQSLGLNPSLESRKSLGYLELELELFGTSFTCVYYGSLPPNRASCEVRSDPLLEFHSIPRNNTRHCHSQRFVLTSVCVSENWVVGRQVTSCCISFFLPSSVWVGEENLGAQLNMNYVLPLQSRCTCSSTLERTKVENICVGAE